jgi:hypothetical protein
MLRKPILSTRSQATIWRFYLGAPITTHVTALEQTSSSWLKKKKRKTKKPQSCLASEKLLACAILPLHWRCLFDGEYVTHMRDEYVYLVRTFLFFFVFWSPVWDHFMRSLYLWDAYSTQAHEAENILFLHTIGYIRDMRMTHRWWLHAIWIRHSIS